MMKYPRRLLCCIMVLIMLINMMPISTHAEETTSEPLEGISHQEEITEEAYVVEEIVDNRTEYVKEFQLSNGMRMASVYSEPVHYDENGTWKEIDNTLKIDNTRSTNAYINTAGDWKVSFPQTLSKSNGVTISKDGFTLNFRMTGELHSVRTGIVGDEIMNASGDELSELESESSVNVTNQESETVDSEFTTLSLSSPAEMVAASVESIDMADMKLAAEYPEAVVEKNTSRLRYANVYENTDVVFDLVSNRLKESIVLKSYSKSLYGYSYELSTGEMVPVLQENGEIELRDPDSQQVVMHMPAPFLVDNMGAVSNDVDVSLTGSQGTYTLTYSLPKEWLADEERQWPVILDPVIGSVADNSNAEDETFYQMYASSTGGSAMNCGYYSGVGCARIFMKYKQLPSLTSADVVVQASITLAAYSKQGSTPAVVEIREVTESWSKKDSKKYWDNQPTFSNVVEDYAYCTTAEILSWDITDLVRKWYTGSNFGLVVKISDANEAAKVANYMSIYPSTWVGDGKPVLTIVYRNNNGLESYWDYTTASAGRAGTGYVNQYTGNLVWVHDDIGFGGNRMPVSVSHIYNANDSLKNDYGMGYGWRTNFNQKVYRYAANDYYYVWEDADGTAHYFAYDSADTYKDEDGLELTLKTNGSGNTKKYSITDKYGNISYFDSSGRLSVMENNQKTKSSITITYTSAGYISQIKDGANRVYRFTYSNNLLSKITYVGTGSDEISSVSFGYSNSNLTSVTYKDSKTSQYTYASSTHLLLTAKDIDGYKLTYTYTDGEPSKVASITEHSGSTSGGSQSMSYAHNQTAITDHNGNKLIYQFNNWGNTISVQDNQGRAQYAQYALNEIDESSSSTAKGNQLNLDSKMQNTVGNILSDGSFESSSAWTATSTEITCTRTTADSYMGNGAMQMTRSVSGEAQGIKSATLSLYPNVNYTISAYVKTVDASAYWIYTDDDTFIIGDVLPANSDWTRLSLSITADTTVSNAVFKLVTNDAGTIYMDCVQLEKAQTPSRYNLVQNGDFSYSTVWSSSNGRTTMAWADKVPAYQINTSTYKMSGSPTNKQRLAQTVVVNGNAGDTFVLAGWARGNSAPLYDHDGSNSSSLAATEFAIIATVDYATKPDGIFKAQFNPDMNMSNDWQYSATVIVAEEAYSSIKIELAYDYNINEAYFDGIQLFKEEFGSSYTYDEDGNIISVKDLQAQTTSYQFDNNNNLTKATLPSGLVLTYKYDNYHNVTEASSNTGLKYAFTYDDYGNNTSVSITSGTVSMTSTAEYSSDKNRLVSTRDAAGNTTVYEYDAQTNVLNRVKYPNDTTGDNNTPDTRTSYTYDTMYRLASAAMTTNNGENLFATYNYSNDGCNHEMCNNDMLKQVTTGSTSYQFHYGPFSLRSNIKIGEHTLASYNYTTDGNYYLDRLDYGNGDKVEYDYDSYGRVTQQTYEDGDTVTYQYDNSGALAVVTDSASGISTTYYYDLTDRLVKIVDGNSDFSRRVEFFYNEKNQLTKKSEFFGDVRHNTYYSYDKDNRQTMAGTSISLRKYTYDAYGRQFTRKSTYNSNAVLTETFGYDSAGRVTSLEKLSVSNGESSTTSYNYTYDGNGNILSINNGTNTISYVYDSANQLVRENNPVAGKTWKWTYDNAGNIASRTEYAYTTDPIPSNPVETVSYGYDDTWGDLLNSIIITDANNSSTNVPISSDTIGNMLSDGKRTYTWEHGRELATVTQNGTTWTNTYDASGLRTKRTDGTTTYRYRYTDGQLATMNINDDVEMWFMYDSNGPMVIKYGNAESHQVYHYELNLQGDIVAIISTSGERVVEYTYDAWGNVLSITGSAADTIGVNNPLRYRGYVYDQDTELYYLQSRYYNPELGRFLNADVFVSTGQGLLGNNMFAYCENNPVYYSDPSGMIRNTFLGDNHVLSDNILMSGGGGGITASSRISSSTVIANEIAFIHNDDPTVVLNAENIAFYRGAPVIKVKAMDDSAFSFGIILMGPNVTSPELVKHERGHVDQLVEIGMSNYAMLVVAPSLDCYWMSRFEILPSSLYHSLPWEYKANEYGQAHFPVFGWAQTASDVYWLFVQIMSGLL